MKRTVVCLFTIFVFVVALTVTSNADHKDTPDDVISAGRATLIKLDDLLRDLNNQLARADDKTKVALNQQIATLRRLRPLILRLSQDRSFAVQVLEPSLRNDKTTLSQILGRQAPGLTLQVREIRDWSVYAIVEVSRYEKYEVCIGSDCKNGGFINRI